MRGDGDGPRLDLARRSWAMPGQARQAVAGPCCASQREPVNCLTRTAVSFTNTQWGWDGEGIDQGAGTKEGSEGKKGQIIIGTSHRVRATRAYLYSARKGRQMFHVKG